MNRSQRTESPNTMPTYTQRDLAKIDLLLGHTTARELQELEANLSLGARTASDVLRQCSDYRKAGNPAGAYKAANLLIQNPRGLRLTESVRAQAIAIRVSKDLGLNALEFQHAQQLNNLASERWDHTLGRNPLTPAAHPEVKELAVACRTLAAAFHQIALRPDFGHKVRQSALDNACVNYVREMIARDEKGCGIPRELVDLARKEGFQEHELMRFVKQQ